MRIHRALSLLALIISTIACGLALTPPAPTSAPARSGPAPTPNGASVLVGAYDPARDPAQDLKAAIKLAQAANKRIMLEVGGEWCGWCHIMDAFYDDHPELTQLRDANYILVKVNMSEENENRAFLSQYPDIPGYPHVFILDSGGRLLQSQDTSQLEEGESYNLDKFTAFLKKWAP